MSEEENNEQQQQQPEQSLSADQLNAVIAQVKAALSEEYEKKFEELNSKMDAKIEEMEAKF